MPKITIELPAEYAVTSRGSHVNVNVGDLSADIIAKLAMHGLGQKVGDSAAGAIVAAGFAAGTSYKDLNDDEKAKVNAKVTELMQAVVDSLVKGEWSERRAGVAVDPLVGRTLRVFGEWLRANAADVWKANFKPLEAAERAEALQAFFAQQEEATRDTLTKMAADELAAEAKAKAKLAKVAIAIKR